MYKRDTDEMIWADEATVDVQRMWCVLKQEVERKWLREKRGGWGYYYS